MGLLSKKIYVCSRCGSEFEARLKPSNMLCKKCKNKEKAELEKIRQQEDEIKEEIAGYVRYSEDLLFKDLHLDELKAMRSHRNDLFEKYKTGITKELLRTINFEEMDYDELSNAKNDLNAISMTECYGYVNVPNNFIALNGELSGILIDKDDVFAVTYISDSSSVDYLNYEAIKVIVFTNDPYVPAFATIRLGKISTFSITKSKELRKLIEFWSTIEYKNLKYPVQEWKQFKKLLKKDGKNVKGNISYDEIVDLMDKAEYDKSYFKSSNMGEYLDEKSNKLLNNMGYFTKDQIYTLTGVYLDD